MTKHSNRSPIAAASVPAIFFSLFAILPFAAFFGNSIVHSRQAMTVDLSLVADPSHTVIR